MHATKKKRTAYQKLWDCSFCCSTTLGSRWVFPILIPPHAQCMEYDDSPSFLPSSIFVWSSDPLEWKRVPGDLGAPNDPMTLFLDKNLQEAAMTNDLRNLQSACAFSLPPKKLQREGSTFSLLCGTVQTQCKHAMAGHLQRYSNFTRRDDRVKGRTLRSNQCLTAVAMASCSSRRISSISRGPW